MRPKPGSGSAAKWCLASLVCRRWGARDEPSRQSQETLPDAGVVAGHWETKQLQSDSRYFFGEPMTASSLNALGQQWTGRIGPLIAAQQSWLAGRRVLPAKGWQFHSLNEGEADA